MKLKRLIGSIFIVLIIFNSNIFGSEIGKIISKSEADILFGAVIESMNMSNEQLNGILLQTSDKVFFHFENNTLKIMGDGGVLIYPAGGSLVTGEKYTAFSKSVVMSLIAQNGTPGLNLERRNSVFSISTDSKTLEFGIGCPPYCD